MIELNGIFVYRYGVRIGYIRDDVCWLFGEAVTVERPSYGDQWHDYNPAQRRDITTDAEKRKIKELSDCRNFIIAGQTKVFARPTPAVAGEADVQGNRAGRDQAAAAVVDG